MKDWHSGVVAVRVTDDTGEVTVHIVNRDAIRAYLERSRNPPKSPRSPKWRGGEAKTYCGHSLDLSVLGLYSEAEATEVNCDKCMAEFADVRLQAKLFLEYVQAIAAKWDEEREQRERIRKQEEETLELIRYGARFNKGVAQLEQPIATLELPSDLEAKLQEYGSLGELMLLFVLCGDVYQSLVERVGLEGVALIRAALLYKRYFEPEDMEC